MLDGQSAKAASLRLRHDRGTEIGVTEVTKWLGRTPFLRARGCLGREDDSFNDERSLRTVLPQRIKRASCIFVSRVDSQHFREFSRRFDGAPLPLERQSEPVVRLRMIRIQAQRFAELRDCLVEPPLR